MNDITNLPQILMPGEIIVRKAVSKLNNEFPGIFKNVKEIRVSSEGANVAHVTNDPKFPGVIFLDFYKIKSQISSRINQPGEAQEDALINAIAETLAHEIGHLDSNFQGNEFPAEQKARQTMQQLLGMCKLFVKYAKRYSS